jgi:hypothetical protein
MGRIFMESPVFGQLYENEPACPWQFVHQNQQVSKRAKLWQVIELPIYGWSWHKRVKIFEANRKQLPSVTLGASLSVFLKWWQVWTLWKVVVWRLGHEPNLCTRWPTDQGFDSEEPNSRGYWKRSKDRPKHLSASPFIKILPHEYI